MDLHTECIPLGHIQTYFNLRRSLVLKEDWLAQRSKLQERDPHELLKLIIGIDEHEFYHNAGIDYHPEAEGQYINCVQCLALVDQAIRALDMPYLGLVMGNLMTISHHGMAGMAAVTQQTLVDCIEVVSRFCTELFPPLEMTPRIDGYEGMLLISQNVSLAPYTHFFLELNTVSFYNIFLHLVGDSARDVRVEFSYPEPQWGYIYRRYFKCPVYFDKPETRIVGDARLANFELPLANKLMAMSAEKTLFENIPTRAARLLPLRLRRMLLRYYGAFPSLEKAANEMGMSSRTLRRKLANGGTSYQQELDAVREKLAKNYFLRGGSSITELALALGYTDSSAFAKAFRRWTGTSPTEFLERKVECRL